MAKLLALLENVPIPCKGTKAKDCHHMSFLPLWGVGPRDIFAAST